MTQFINQLINFFALPQGNLTYSLLLGVLAFGASQSGLYASGYHATPVGQRIQKGLLYLLIAQMVLFTISWLAWIGILDGHSYIPPLERMLASFSLVLIIWLWVFPKSSRVVDIVFRIIEVLVLIAGIFSLYWWSRNALDNNFNTSVVGAYAYYLGIFLVLVGLLLLLWLRPAEWLFGILMLGILLAGYISQYVAKQPPGDYPWLVKLGEVAAFSLLLALPRRLVPLRGDPGIPRVEKRAHSSLSESTRFIEMVLDLISEKSPQKSYQKITQIIAQALNADACLLVMPPRSGEQLIVLTGYVTAKDQSLDGFTLDGRRIPIILEAVRKQTPLAEVETAPEAERITLTSELGLEKTTRLTLLPFHPRDSHMVMELMVFSNAAQTAWAEEDGLQLAEAMNKLMGGGSQIGLGTSAGANQNELEQCRQAYAQLKSRFDVLNSQASTESSRTEETQAMLERQKSLQELVIYLDARNHELENLVTKSRPSIDELDQLRHELRTALEDLARIPAAISKSDQKMLELQLSAMKQLDDIGQSELVTSIAQEFRQPLSSISGYTDLLLEESVGILGATQRKFLERIKASTERLGTLTNDLVQMLAIDAGKLDTSMVNVELETIIDEAVGDIIAQISEKNITLRVDLPEKLPAIQANKDGFQQILANLLQNACLVTPNGGEIRLLARIEKKDMDLNYLLVSVTDQGGGIAKFNIPKIFSRHYKDDNPVIPGIGDTGVGLSIAKSLVELQKGRIWVDTLEGSGSTFSCILPLVESQPEPDQAGK